MSFVSITLPDICVLGGRKGEGEGGGGPGVLEATGNAEMQAVPNRGQ